MNKTCPSLFTGAVFVICVAFAGCSPKSEPASSGGSASSGGRGGASAGGTGGAQNTGGAPANNGGGGGGGAGGAGGTSGSGGNLGGSGGLATGTDGSGGVTGDAAPSDSSSGDAVPAASGSSCAGKNYALCIDFETGIDTAVWAGGTPGAVVTTHPAHGTKSYRLYPMGGGVLKTTKLGGIKDQIWGRFYVHFNPGAPGGHGNIVGAFDQMNNWYEMGWQFDAMMGVYHLANGNERPLRSMPLILDQWYCVEFLFDGTKTEMPKWWIDGTEAMYYMPANTQLIPRLVPQFARIEVGFTPYAGLGLQMPDGKGPPDSRVLKEMWIDDIAFDTKRIGCIEGPVGGK